MLTINWFIKHKFISGFIVLLVVGAIAANSNLAKNTGTSEPTPTRAKVEKSSPIPTEKHTSTQAPKPLGLNVARSYMIGRIQQAAAAANSVIEFKAGVPIDGQGNYIANQGQNIIQLIGPKDNLTEVSSTALIGDNPGDNLLALVYIMGVANLIDSHSTAWVINAMKDEIDPGQGISKQSKNINNRKYEVDMNIIGNYKAYTLTVDPVEQKKLRARRNLNE